MSASEVTDLAIPTARPIASVGLGRMARVVEIAMVGMLIGIPWLFESLYLAGWLGYACLIIRATQRSPAGAFAESMIAGAIALGIAFHWAANSFYATTDLPYWLAAVIAILLVIWESIAFGCLGLAASLLAARGNRWLWLLVPIWVTIETHWPRIFSWATAHAYLGFPPVLQLAQYAGTAGVTACVVLGSVALARWWRERRNRSACIESALAFGLIFVACLWGAGALADWRQQIAVAPKLRVAAMQVDPNFVESLGRMQRLSDSVEKQVDLLVWPESTLGHYDVRLDRFGDFKQTCLMSEMPNPAVDPYPRIHCDLLAGGKTYDAGAKHQGPYKNTAFLIDHGNQIVGRYVKRTLMPVGEYVPGETWLPALRQWFGVTVDLVRGTSDEPLVLSGGERVGILVCYEDMVAANAAASVREGAELLVALVNGSAFKDHDTLRQHLALAQLRTIENRRALVRCAATGVTCLVGPDGEIKQQLPIGVDEQMLLVDVPVMIGTTFYTRHGDWFATTAGITALFGCIGWAALNRHDRKRVPLVDS